jgi:flagellar hook protein FlgE
MKNWLIRTRQKQILGPISREKVLELLDKGAINIEDELCSGNGFWIYAKEKNLVDMYIRKGDFQPFNPISEAKSQFKIRNTATAHEIDSSEDNSDQSSAVESTLMLNIDSLSDIPTLESASSEVNVNLDDEPALEKKNLKNLAPDSAIENASSDKSVSDLPQINIRDKKNNDSQASNQRKSRKNIIVKNSEEAEKEIVGRNDRYLFLLALVALLLIVGVVFYYKKLLNRPLPIPGIDNADAQTISSFESLSKKKRFLN